MIRPSCSMGLITHLVWKKTLGCIFILAYDDITLLAQCGWNLLVGGRFLSQSEPIMQSFDVFAVFNLNTLFKEHLSGHHKYFTTHYNGAIMGVMVSQITSISVSFSTVCSGADQRKHQSAMSLAFVRGIHWWPVNSQHKRASNGENVSIWWCHHDKKINKFPTTDVHCRWCSLPWAPLKHHQRRWKYWHSSLVRLHRYFWLVTEVIKKDGP